MKKYNVLLYIVAVSVAILTLVGLQYASKKVSSKPKATNYRYTLTLKNGGVDSVNSAYTDHCTGVYVQKGGKYYFMSDTSIIVNEIK